MVSPRGPNAQSGALLAGMLWVGIAAEKGGVGTGVGGTIKPTQLAPKCPCGLSGASPSPGNADVSEHDTLLPKGLFGIRCASPSPGNAGVPEQITLLSKGLSGIRCAFPFPGNAGVPKQDTLLSKGLSGICCISPPSCRDGVQAQGSVPDLLEYACAFVPVALARRSRDRADEVLGVAEGVGGIATSTMPELLVPRSGGAEALANGAVGVDVRPRSVVRQEEIANGAVGVGERPRSVNRERELANGEMTAQERVDGTAVSPPIHARFGADLSNGPHDVEARVGEMSFAPQLPAPHSIGEVIIAGDEGP